MTLIPGRMVNTGHASEPVICTGQLLHCLRASTKYKSPYRGSITGTCLALDEIHPFQGIFSFLLGSPLDLYDFFSMG